MKKSFPSVSLLPSTKKLGRSSYNVIVIHYDIISVLFLFRFIANVHDLEWNSFLVLFMNRRGVIRTYFWRAKMTRV